MAIIFVPVVLLLAAGITFLIMRSGGGEHTPEIGVTASATLKAPSGDPIGTVKFRQVAAGVLVAAEARDLVPGGHAFVIHETGACTPDFGAAGDHFNPTDAEHGFVHSNWRRGDSGAGGHGGDLPNIYAASDGSARADFFTDGITLDVGPRHSVFDDDGSAIIVHEKPDAYGEEESDTGARVACGVIRRG